MAEKVRVRVRISGWVQGVAFRYKTKEAASENDVNGWVKNKADGSVEALFEGDKDKVDIVIKWCEKGPAMAVVKDVAVEWEDYKGEFSRFDIRF